MTAERLVTGRHGGGQIIAEIVANDHVGRDGNHIAHGHFGLIQQGQQRGPDSCGLVDDGLGNHPVGTDRADAAGM